MFCKNGILRNFGKFTGKHLCQSLYFNKVASLRPATLFKKRLWHRCFPVNFAKFLKTLFFTEHLWWLLLNHLAISSSNNLKNISNFEGWRLTLAASKKTSSLQVYLAKCELTCANSWLKRFQAFSIHIKRKLDFQRKILVARCVFVS